MSNASNSEEVKNQVLHEQTVHGSLYFGPVTNLINHHAPAAPIHGTFDRDKDIIASLAFPRMLEQRNSIDQPHETTCNWVFDLDQYKEWKAQPCGFLWIKGKPGAGKSTLMLHLYRTHRECRSPSHEIDLDFFFAASGVELQRTPLGMLRSLMNQLFRQDINVRSAIRDVYEERCNTFGREDRNWEWQRPELEHLFSQAIITSTKHQQITVFIDALDETGARYADEIIRYLHRIHNRVTALGAKLRFCIASRHYPIISTVKGFEIVVDQHNSNDIANWIHDYLDLDAHSLQHDDLDQSIWHPVKYKFVKQAQGVFQWVRLVAPTILKAIHEGLSPEIAATRLSNISEELGDIYAHIVSNVLDPRFRMQSFLLFLWVCFAERPLSPGEMRHALAESHVRYIFPCVTDHELTVYAHSNEVTSRRVKALSGGLVELIHDSANSTAVIAVVHQSVKDFIIANGLRLLDRLLRGDRIETSMPPTAKMDQPTLINHCNALLYRCCLRYFALESCHAIESAWERINESPGERNLVRKDLTSSLPLAGYAALFMFLHAEKAHSARFDNISYELSLLRQGFLFWSKAFSIFQENSGRYFSLQQSLLHVVAGADMVDMVMHLLQPGHTETYSVHRRDRDGLTPLHHASARGHRRACDILLQEGADINASSRLGMTPIILAASKGHVKLVSSLLINGAEVNKEASFSTIESVGPLYVAALGGHTAVVKVLIEAGADVNEQREYGTPLDAAIFEKKDNIVRMLLDAGADPRPSEKGLISALHTAAEHGTEGVIYLLLNAGVDINARAGVYNTALQAAAVSGKEHIVQLLLNAGADVNVQGGFYGTAIQAAAAFGNDAVLRMLLEAGANMTIEGGKFGSVFRAAAYGGHTATVKMLLEAGVDVNTQSGGQGTALQAAAISGMKETIRILLDSGANPNILGGAFGTVLQATAHTGSVEIARMLLDAGADVNAQGGEYHTALQAASFTGHKKVVQMLVDAGADPNITGGTYHTALQAAVARYGNSCSIVRILLTAGADVHLHGGLFGSALEAAKAYGAQGTIELLMEAGAGKHQEEDRPKKKPRKLQE